MTEERLVEFAGLLRQNGLRLSPGELADASRALTLVPLEDRSAVHATLRATLVKRGQDAALFDRLFELYFGAIGRLLEGLEETLAKGLSLEGLSLEDLQQIAKELTGMGQGGALADALVRGELGEVAKLLRTAALQVDFSRFVSPLQRGFFARRIGAGVGLSETARAFRALSERLRERGLNPSQLERVSTRLSEAVAAVEDAAKRAADLEWQARDRESLTGERDAVLHKRIATLTPEELAHMRRLVRRLAEKLKARIARKRKLRRRGQLHVRRTLRRNLELGGLPARLSFRAKRPERPDVVVLCDVSDSVRNVSRLSLQFMHTLQSLYTRVRSFVFVSDLAEITALLKDASVEEAVDGALAARAINLSANSNYGHALRLFHRDFAGAVTRRTTLLVIGDGRTNHQAPNAWVLDDLKRRAKQVVWLCPEERNAWGFGDSEMPLYARHCREVFVVRTADELARAVERLLP